MVSAVVKDDALAIKLVNCNKVDTLEGRGKGNLEAEFRTLIQHVSC